MFYKVVTVARLKKRHIRAVDKRTQNYDQTLFRLDERMYLYIAFQATSMVTQCTSRQMLRNNYFSLRESANTWVLSSIIQPLTLKVP